MEESDMTAFIIPYKGKLFQETRNAYFLKAFGEDVKEMRIIPFGRCNYACPYCKRNGYDKDDGSIKGSIEVEEEAILYAAKDAVAKHQIVRLSGGDPCTYADLSIKVLEQVKQLGGIGSMAHNGSSPEFIQYLVDKQLLDSISVDLKGKDPQSLKKVTGISEKLSYFMWSKTLETLEVLKRARHIKIDIRTCVFSDTTYEELLSIGKIIKQYSNPNVFWTLRIYSIVDSFSKETKTVEDMKLLAKLLSIQLFDLKIGIRVKWEKGAFFYYFNGKEV